jgi:hypothetical protein
MLRKLLVDKNFCDNQISNIVCSKTKSDGSCNRAIKKLLEQKDKIFFISPRAIVYCILNKNIPILICLQKLGYPIEIAEYADNFHILQKKTPYNSNINSILNQLLIH